MKVKEAIFKQTQTQKLMLKKCFLWNAAKLGYQYIFVCKQINLSMLMNVISEDSIFMVNVEQYLLRSR